MFYLNIISAKVILGENWETKVINRKNIPQCDNNTTEVWKRRNQVSIVEIM